MSTKTTSKETKGKKQEFKQSLITMWIKKSKSGSNYFSGVDASGKYITGFLNGKKKNPKEPDIRLYYSDEEGGFKDEIASLWVNTSKNDKKYIAGTLHGEKVVGFINSKATVGGKIPYFNIYQSEATPKTKEPEASETDSDELPFK